MKKLIVIGAVVIFLLIAGSLAVFGMPGKAQQDSGITACQEIKANAESGKKSSGAKMTEEQYKAKRAPFENSEFADLKVAGTNLVDSIYQMDQKKDDGNLTNALVTLHTIQNQYAALQTACANHGVDLPNLKV